MAVLKRQLIKLNGLSGYTSFVPYTTLLAITDEETGLSLFDFVRGFNHLSAEYQTNKEDTRSTIPLFLRKRGAYLTYIVDNTVITEVYIGPLYANNVQEADWRNNNNWVEVFNNG